MAIRNRELSQFGSFIHIDDNSKGIGIATESTPYVGIGTTNPTSKLHVVGNTNISGIVSATGYFLNGSPLVDAAVEVWSLGSGSDIYRENGNVGIGTTQPQFKLDVNGDINFTGTFYQNGDIFVGSQWYEGSGSDIYKLNGNVGVGTSVPSQKLSVIGNVSANKFISTTLTGEPPFEVQSETVVTNLNAYYLRGGVPGQNVNSNDIVTLGATQTLSNKTLTSPTISSIENSGAKTIPTGIGTFVITNSVGLVTSGMIASGTITNSNVSNSAGITYSKLNLSNSILNADIAIGAGITYGKLSLTNSILGSDIVNLTIPNSKLQNSTISGVSLGSTLSNLTFGTYLQAGGSSYNGSSAVTISLNASSLNTPNTVVVRDSSGNFNGNLINANNFVGTGITVSQLYANGTVGTAGSVLTSTGSGIAWGSLSAVNIQTFSSSGTWTKPSGAKIVLVRCWGAGGGGESGRSDFYPDSTTLYGGAGGQGGSFSEKLFISDELPSTVTVTVGAGGTGGKPTSGIVTETWGFSGNNGGNTSFGNLVKSWGGIGGANGTRYARTILGQSIAYTSSYSDLYTYSYSSSPFIGGVGGIDRSGSNLSAVASVYGGAGGGYGEGTTAVAGAGATVNDASLVGGSAGVTDGQNGGNGVYFGVGAGGGAKSISGISSGGSGGIGGTCGGGGGGGIALISGIGQSTFTTVGSSTFIVPQYVKTLSAVCVGGGGGGARGASGAEQAGGGGGGLRWVSNIPVTPGESLTINVGVGGTGGTTNGSNGGNGGDSSILRGASLIIFAGGGRGATYNASLGLGSAGIGGTGTVVGVYTGGGNGGAGGTSGTASGTDYNGGGGGAGGYFSGNSGLGGAGADGTLGISSAGDWGSAGGGNRGITVGGGGGGVGILTTIFANGTSGGGGGTGGSNGGTADVSGNGGVFGGGGGGADGQNGGNGGQGVVRIIWGVDRVYDPDTGAIGSGISTQTTYGYTGAIAGAGGTGGNGYCVVYSW